MSKYQKIFERVEKKYLLDEKKYKLLMSHIQQYVVPDDYGESAICNIYFDTPDSKLIRTSLEKPIYKEKMRMRSYGVPTSSDTVFIELKKKFKNVVYKRRMDMTLSQAKDFVNGKGGPKTNIQIENEVKWVMGFYENLEPAMFLSYNRTAFYAIDNEDVRITFDTGITYRDEALSLDKGIWGKELLNHGEKIMEIKIPDSMPIWLSNILDKLEIYSTSFSKYGTAYQCVQKEKLKNGKVNYCA